MATKTATKLGGEVVSAIMTLHRNGLLAWKAECDCAQAELTVYVEETADVHGNFVPCLRISHEDLTEFSRGKSEELAAVFPIDSETYQVFTKGIPGLYQT